jgi:uncharacterized protein (TIGR02996 family)
MSERDALLAAILADPDEDTPRLAFADYLEENGDPHRAEFIRVQVELARLREAERDLPESFGDEATGYAGANRAEYRYCRHFRPERVALLGREAELLAGGREQWQAGLPRHAAYPRFRRGFVGAAEVPLTRLVQSPASLWGHHPIESLELRSASGQATAAKVPRCAWLDRVRELGFPYTGAYALLAPFAQCPHLAKLRSLHIDTHPFVEEDAAAFALSEHLRPESFTFPCGNLSREAFAALLHSPFASRLRHLNPSDVGEWGLEEVAAAPLDNLRWLQIGGSDAGVRALRRSERLTRLVTLCLSGEGITDGAAEALAAWPGLAGVRSLNLSGSDVTGLGIEALVKSPHFRPVHLDLSQTTIGDIGAVALARWPGLANVVALDANHSQVCDTGGTALARSPHWGDLRCLRLSTNSLRRATIPLYERFGDAFTTFG